MGPLATLGPFAALRVIKRLTYLLLDSDSYRPQPIVRGCEGPFAALTCRHVRAFASQFRLLFVGA